MIDWLKLAKQLSDLTDEKELLILDPFPEELFNARYAEGNI